MRASNLTQALLAATERTNQLLDYSLPQLIFHLHLIAFLSTELIKPGCWYDPIDIQTISYSNLWQVTRID
jgi:hypothetical protein